MKSIFLRVLFGDDVMQRRGKVLDDIRKMVDWPRQESPLVVMAFGRENYEFLKECGYDPYLLHEDATPKFLDVQEERGDDGRGAWPWGMSLWMYKVYAIQRAFEVADELIYLDWDCRLMKDLPDDFWEMMRQGPVIQMPLVGFKWKICKFRESDKRKVGEGAFIYLRDKSIADKVAELYEQYPTADDQVLWAMVTDELMPGWREKYKDEPEPYLPAYRDAGHDPGCVRIYKALLPPKDEDVVFRCTLGPKNSTWQRKQAMRKARKGLE